MTKDTDTYIIYALREGSIKISDINWFRHCVAERWWRVDWSVVWLDMEVVMN
jgi:hypothetical protein